jgi:hypothetical protein
MCTAPGPVINVIESGSHMVAHACNPSYPGGSDRKILVWAILGKVSETLSQKQVRLTVVAHACNPSYVGGGDQEDSSSKLALAKS